ncbi:MAG: penicillin-binding transpeptidase domain-containing protein [Candidatus Pacebacteria bacterium]|jgi:penicillin-binding protein 2|nr:penicillin-binding transpeptidase domain-containing protein [Candidatus Paceibacterota bacterium]
MSKRVSSKFLKQLSRDIDPDEIFLDSKNLPGFDRDQFEGRIEKPISRGAIWGVFAAFSIVAIIFIVKITSLQIVHGEEYLKKSENNRLDHKPLFAMRGVVYDRNKVPLAWNSFDDEAARIALIMSETSTTTEAMPFPHRSYISAPGFGHTLGYVSYPKRDTKGRYYQELFVGKDGIEEHYNELLSGENGLQIVETDALGKTREGSIVEEPQNGAALTLGIDARVQEKLHTTIRATANDFGYMAGAGALMDIETGELLAMTSYPEYESAVLSEGKNKKLIQSYNLDKRAVFLDRAVSGVYTPGSIIKPFMAIAGLAEGVITTEKQILSTGSISIQHPYYPNIKSVFNDWKAHGWVDMRRAIAVSSDVYFYEIGGGFENQKGIGIENIGKYARMFGFGSITGIDITDEKAGTIPSPEWKKKMFEDGDWRLGDTYHTVIGQYGFQSTLLQAVRGVASIANDGTLVTPHLLKDPVQDFATSKIDIPSSYLQVAREGMRQAVREGTVSGLGVGYVTVAGKTGTAEIDAGKKYINSWVVGFFPYEKPRYAFAVVMERGPHDNTIGGVYVMRQLFDWMYQNTPEYLK